VSVSEWVRNLRSLASSAAKAAAPEVPHPTFATVKQINPLRIALDSDPSNTLPFAPACVGTYPTAVGQRVFVQSFGRQLVVLGVLAEAN